MTVSLKAVRNVLGADIKRAEYLMEFVDHVETLGNLKGQIGDLQKQSVKFSADVESLRRDAEAEKQRIVDMIAQAERDCELKRTEASRVQQNAQQELAQAKKELVSAREDAAQIRKVAKAEAKEMMAATSAENQVLLDKQADIQSEIESLERRRDVVAGELEKLRQKITA